MKIVTSWKEKALESSEPGPLFYSNSYLIHQEYEHLVRFSSVGEGYGIHIVLDIQHKKAISLPKTLFGSFWSQRISFDQFVEFEIRICDMLRKAGIKAVEIIHPSSIIPTYVPSSWLVKVGYARLYEEINQHIDLTGAIEVHPMELRKLNRNESRFSIDQSTDFSMLHDFIRQCRLEQGLEINIEKNTLLNLIQSNPDRYLGFTVKDDDMVISALIAVIISPEVVYYYLPATRKAYRSSSPMVSLMDYIYRYFKTTGFKTLDLGISSKRGIPQQGLYEFKKRMGARETSKKVFIKELV